MTSYNKCQICGYGVESINDLTICGHCKKQSCPNCGSPVADGVFSP